MIRVVHRITGAVSAINRTHTERPTEYVVGRRVRCHEWDPDPRVVCAGGIHWFLTRAEAEAW